MKDKIRKGKEKDWVEYTKDYKLKEQIAKLEAKLEAIECGECGKNLLECEC